MTSVRRIVCPSCEAGLKVAATLPPEKRIRCPKCMNAFRFTEARDWAPAARKSVLVPSRKKGAVLSDDDLEPAEPRLPARKKSKKKLTLSRPVLFGLVAVGAVLVIGVGITLALVRPWETKKTPSVANNQPGTSQPRPARPRKMPGGEAPPKEPAGGESAGKNSPGGKSSGDAAEGESLPAPAGKEEALPMNLAAGKKIYDALDCAKCHTIGGSQGGGFKKGNRGPNLTRVGADPAHTTEWLSQQIRNPRSHRPNPRMPPYPEDKISSDDLRSLTEYLASLK
jgi:mono/diheme cytochrome c family protein